VVVLGTAHAAKFPDAVEAACGQRPALPEWLADLTFDLVRQSGIDDREERFWQRRRQFALGQELYVDIQAPLGYLHQEVVVLPSRIDLMELNDCRDLLRQHCGKPHRDSLPMPLHENISKHALQDHHRRDDNEKRPCVEALGQKNGKFARESPPPGARLREGDGEGKAQGTAPV